MTPPSLPLLALLTLTATTATVTIAQAQTPPPPSQAEAHAELVTPVQWLRRQPKPVFKAGHTLPLLTRFGWSLTPETRIELADNWHYALEFGGYLADRVLERALTKPDSPEAKMLALAKENPQKYRLAVICSRDEPKNPAPETFLRDAQGNLLQNRGIYSPLNPQSVLDQMGEVRAEPLRRLRAMVPISIILNGGEYGLGVLGFMKKFAEQDPRVMGAKGEEDWFPFISRAKGRERETIANAIRKAVPDRDLYIYYSSGNGARNQTKWWGQWGYDDSFARQGSDLPSNEFYYRHFNSGYIPDSIGNDLLTRALNATGFQLKQGKKNSYDWLSAGWVYEADAHGRPLKRKESAPEASGSASPGGSASPAVMAGNDAALVDPSAGRLSRMDLYTGFLKCLFTTGSLGGNAGYYAYPLGGFGGSFPADKPAHWLPQMTALSQVQALFSYLEGDLRHGDLLPGPRMHRWSQDQPAYEFPTGQKNVRVLARKTPSGPRWIITAWAADGNERDVKVDIPELGAVDLLARPAGSVYRATLKEGQADLLLLDPEPMTPTAHPATLARLQKDCESR